jgi:hypothetical protein
MVMSTVTTELTKIALGKLAELRPDDVAKAARALGKLAGGGSLLIPGLGAFGIGLAIGAGIGLLTAPRAGNETRKLVGEAIRKRYRQLMKKREPAEAADGEPLVASEESIGSANGGARD